MSDWSDKTKLREVQYKDASNLSARVALHQRFSVNPQSWYGWLFDRLELPHDARVLEIGCGYGGIWQALAERVPPGWNVTLTDLSDGMLDAARTGLAAGGRRFGFQVADAEDLPFDDAAFDAVLANHMLHHVPDRPKALAEIRRVLKPEGRLYAAANGEAHMAELRDLLADFDPGHELLAQDPTTGFTLENGGRQLEPFFERVRLHRFEDALQVTEVEPLLGYVLSMSGVRARWSEERQADFRALLERQLRRNGTTAIRKAAGVFEGIR